MCKLILPFVPTDLDNVYGEKKKPLIGLTPLLYGIYADWATVRSLGWWLGGCGPKYQLLPDTVNNRYNLRMNKKFDAVVIGAGSGGLSSAVGLAKVGKKVLLIERDKMGGECTNSGCVPSKALIHYAKEYHTAARIAGTNTSTDEYRQKAFDYVRRKVEDILADETPEHFKQQGIEVSIGEAVFISPYSLRVCSEVVEFKQAIIATGSSPRQLSVPGLSADKILTNQNLFTLSKLPERLLVVGAGPIGLEMGQALARLGVKVTLLDNGPQLARLEDEVIRPIIKKRLQAEGITIIQNAELTKVENQTAVVMTGNEEIRIDFDKVLIAIGRVPNLPSGLEVAKVKATANGIEVNANWQTSNRAIYALGDVAARLKFTHVADDTARQVVAHIASRGLLKPKVKAVPKVTYTDPEIAQVGLSYAEAKDKFGEAKIFRIEVPLSANDRARTDKATDGILVVIVRRLTGRVLGAHLIGPRAGEIISTLTLAMEENISLYRLRSMIFPYPTYSLIIKRAGDYFLATQVRHLKQDLANTLKSVAPQLIALVLWSSLLYAFYSYQNAAGLSATELSLNIFTFITSTVYGPLLYILVYTMRPLTFFPGTALTILSGMFFGWWGILYTIIGANLSAALAYIVGRFFSRQPTKISTSLLGRMVETIRQNPFLSILTMRLTFFPFDGVNYGAGLLRVPFWPYLLATFVGTLLGIATFVAIGAAISVEELVAEGISSDIVDGRFLAISAIIFVVSVLVAKFLPKSKV